ncbi:MAG: hypothetical protein MUC33_23545 [Desulfobacterales bacterium]|jgi:uncharacterized membrane protein|nr:hypothetical protein [Desulfobacterales bacterium]
MKAFLVRLRRIDLRLVMAALFAIAILHVITALTAPSMALSSAWDRLAPALKANTMIVLPAVTPDAQPLPFMAPDFKHAVCMFDTRNGQVALSALLPSPGWNLTLYDPKGTAIYSATGRPGQATPVSLLLVPDDDRFMGLTPEAQGLRSPRQTELRIQARKGLAILRAPDLGFAYRARTDAELARANCRKVADQR